MRALLRAGLYYLGWDGFYRGVNNIPTPWRKEDAVLCDPEWVNFGAPFGVNASQPNGQVMMATNDGFYVKARPAFVEFNSLNGNITVYYRHPGFSPTENRTVEEGKKVYSTILKEPEGGWGADNSSSAQTYNYKSLPYLMLTQNDWQGQDHPCLDTAEYCMQLCGLILQANMSDDWGLGNHATSEVWVSGHRPCYSNNRVRHASLSSKLRGSSALKRPRDKQSKNKEVITVPVGIAPAA